MGQQVLGKQHNDRGRPFEVLVVEDEPADIELIRMALDSGPYQCNVAVAANGLEAMTFLHAHPPHSGQAPDLVLLDLNMPRMSGHEVLREMKADRSLAAIPVVVLTTSEAEKDVVSCYGLRAGGYVTKPADVNELVNAVHCVEEYWFSTVRRPPRL
ncbi:FOG: CheY-like receiver [Magnetospirillum sp. LM-5]|uniref:response regulator n=1 Tax=Magnetospirillum sp. LM-5 TaxID=2681466 RepID=UPI0013853241|nr:response regulator [Magnetospirillum sp. LM-5]CAA7615604.1 FOG: CheY-like receiver [Magnetospirillum sp. LM-5]